MIPFANLNENFKRTPIKNPKTKFKTNKNKGKNKNTIKKIEKIEILAISNPSSKVLNKIKKGKDKISPVSNPKTAEKKENLKTGRLFNVNRILLEPI